MHLVAKRSGLVRTRASRVASMAGDRTTDARFARFLAAKPRIILGSASKSRRSIMDELAAKLGFAYEVCTADIDEKAMRRDTPEALVLALAHAKADAILERLRAEGGAGGAEGGGDAYLITCDQVVVHEGVVLEKPESAEQARAFIAGYARSAASTVGSVVVTHLASGARSEVLEVVTIPIDPLPPPAVDALIEEGEVMWCAGGLMVEHALVAPHVRGFEGGGGVDSVMGLGKGAVVDALLGAEQAAAAAGGGVA